MKILHTSDLHLKEDHEERLQALKEILSLGKEQNVDLLLVAGDLFDSHEAADRLRPDLRELLSGNPFKILIIPGNHDESSFRTDLYFGDDVEVLVNKPYTARDFDEVRIVGVPYFEGAIEELAIALKAGKADGKVNILLIHCTLDFPESTQEDFGQEARQRYLPISSDMLAELDYDWVLAGHFHSKFMMNPISETSKFSYCGSPASVTKREKGKRSVGLLNTEGGLSSLPLNTYYYDLIEVVFDPSEEEKGVEFLANQIKKYNSEKAELEVYLRGFIKSSEVEFRKRIGEITEGITSVHHEYKGVAKILGDSVYKRFAELLQERNLDDGKRGKIEKVVMNIFSELEAGRRYED